MQDGARNALLGYLYQFIGVASLRALSASDSVHGAWVGLLARVENGHLLHERHGDDAIVKPVFGTLGGSVAIQFKHSSNASRGLSVGEFIDILHGFEMSRLIAQGQGETVSQFTLITNRDLDRRAQSLFDARSGT